jgi:hypothetical protein
MTPRRLWVDQGGSAAGPEPGAASFTLELGGLAVQELVIADTRTHIRVSVPGRGRTLSARLCEAAHYLPDALACRRHAPTPHVPMTPRTRQPSRLRIA